MPTTPTNPSALEAYTSQKEVQDCLKTLREHFHADNPLVVSDVLDAAGNQYVNLVQKGGGVLGVALVGYTYVLEQMGIRFLRMAGTSAGAINTALMTVVGRKEEAKSERIIEIMGALDFFALVDGHPSARWLIKNVIKHQGPADKPQPGETSKEHPNFMTILLRRLLLIMSVLVLLLAADLALLGLEHNYPALRQWTQVCFVVTGFVLAAFGALFFYLTRLLNRLKNAGFGINPGDYFYDWIKKQFQENGVETVTDLRNKAAQPIPGLHLRVEHPMGTTALQGDVTFIASELASGNKIQFPKMCNLFREPENIDELSPAGFVRASMAIPVFFESYFINNIPVDSPAIRQAWLDTFNEHYPPSTARFVDGGLLSNFPISLFFNPHMPIPRLPTFGINLEDSPSGSKKDDISAWGLFGYLGGMLTTLRGHYDKDFLAQNKAYEKGIGTICLHQFNWLNFFVKEDDKKKMFRLGAQAAARFLMEFDWEAYKQEQSAMRRSIAR